jgi:hypothetical protein
MQQDTNTIADKDPTSSAARHGNLHFSLMRLYFEFIEAKECDMIHLIQSHGLLPTGNFWLFYSRVPMHSTRVRNGAVPT